MVQTYTGHGTTTLPWSPASLGVGMDRIHRIHILKVIQRTLLPRYYSSEDLHPVQRPPEMFGRS